MSRDKILAAAKQNKPAPVPLPEIPAFAWPAEDLLASFSAALEKSGGKPNLVKAGTPIAPAVKALYPDAQRIANFVDGDEAENAQLLQDPAAIDVVVLKGQLGVAENAAIWLTDRDCADRVLPFLTQHLVLVIDKDTLVGNMHQAYGVMGQQNPGYGVFIAGPSKTADIEQSLVIGAHGPRSMQVFIVER